MDINKENLIEGIGDEVLIVISLLLITFMVFLLWLSKDLHCLPGYFRRILNQNHTETNINETENNDLLENVDEEEDPENNIIPVPENIASKVTESIHKDRDDLAVDTETNNISNGDGLPNGFITIKLKYLDDRIIIINVDPQSTVLDFKRNNFQNELSLNKAVRLIYNGRELKEMNGEATLAGYGLTHKSTVHCLITNRRENSDPAQNSVNDSSGSGTDINLGNLMFPLFGFVLSLLWYYRLNYKYHFNMMTTFALIGITGMYFIACFVNYSAPIVNYRAPVPDTGDNITL